MKKLWLLLLLSGCAPVFLNDPDLVDPSQVVTEAYKKDLAECKKELTPTAGEVGASIIGPLGVMGAELIDGKGADMFKTSYQLRDECLARKGYKFHD